MQAENPVVDGFGDEKSPPGTSPAHLGGVPTASAASTAIESPTGQDRSSADGGILRRLARWIGPLEIGIGFVLTLASVYLHLVQRANAGGLWRDEATSVRMANLPSLDALWRYVEFDSYPPLFHLLLRGWAAVFGTGDTAYRSLGLLIGLAVLGACWHAARTFGTRAPLLALALLALNPGMVRYGDSLRAYGLGCALAVLTLCAVWRVAALERLHGWRLARAALLGVLSVQCLYHNAALLLASCLGGAVVALWRRRPAGAAVVLAVGVPAALSLLPYLPVIHRARAWSVLIRFPVTLEWLWHKVCDVTGAPDPLGVWLWTALAVAGVGLAGWTAYVSPKATSTEAEAPVVERLLFCGVTLVAATVIYTAFLFSVGYVTQPWYYLGLLTVVAVCCDAIYGQATGLGWRLARWLVMFMFSLLVFPQTLATLHTRSTDVDLVAARINAGVRPGDLVLLNRWETAISFGRYYQGRAPLMTVPDVPDHTVHRYDLILERMMSATPLQPVYEAIDATLQRGDRVWLVGTRDHRRPGDPLPTMPPPWTGADADTLRMNIYYQCWVMAVHKHLATHSGPAVEIPIPERRQVNNFENVELLVHQGWRGEDSPAPPLLAAKPAGP